MRRGGLLARARAALALAISLLAGARAGAEAAANEDSVTVTPPNNVTIAELTLHTQILERRLT